MESNSVRSKALAQGAAWAAGVAAVLAFLKFPDVGPIPELSLSVLSLVIMALGWALLLVKVKESVPWRKAYS